MNFNFKNKNIFISGATHGIGRECILNFAKLGANVITFSRDEKKIINLKKKLNLFRTKYFIEKGNILDEDFIHEFSKSTIKKFKRIDILIHNVGGGGRWGKDNFLKTDINTWDDVYKKNNNGLIIFTKYFLPSMIKNNWGRVIAIGSVCGIENTNEDRPWFTAAKSAQHAIIKSFSKKHTFTKKNITFNSISPGPIFIKNTGWEKIKKKNENAYKNWIKKNIPVNRIGKVEDVSNLVIYLSSNYSSFINGTNIIVDGGKSNKI